MSKQLVLLMGLVFLVSACGDVGTAVSTPTLLPIPTQEAVTAATAVASPSVIAPAVTLEQATAVAEPVVIALDTPTAAPTETALPIPTEAPAEIPIRQPELVVEPVPVVLVDGGQSIFTFDGARFEPWLFFVEASEGLDTAVAIYAAPVDDDTDLTALTAKAAADFTGPGLPELVVFTPDSDGEFSLVVTGKGEGTVFVQSVDSRMVEGTGSSLAAGEVRQGTSYDNQGVASYIFVVPISQADLALRATSLEGEQITEANFGGPGSAEALFVLPPQSAGFNFEIFEANGEPTEYYLIVGRSVLPGIEE